MNDALLFREAVDRALEAALPAPGPADSAASVIEAMRYSLLAGGKRVRPVLTLAFCALCGEDWHCALPFAVGVEMVHTYSLIHDDLPCMDDDDLRRGRPTCHKVYGEAMALLAGDGLLTKAFESVLAFPDPTKASAAAKCLAELAGYQGMVGGQCIDLNAGGQEVTIELLKEMDEGKTVALIDAACRLGCIAAGAGEAQLAAASRYARGIGMAFQIRDDILDVMGDVSKLGKNTGMDAVRDKRNYVSLLGVDTAQELVDSYTGQAVEALGIFPEDKAFLTGFALELASREH